MHKTLLLVAFLFITKNVHAQHIKLDNGIVFSSFYNKIDLPILSSEKLVSYSALLGIDYLEKEWFYLSSQAGYTKVGGKETNPGLEGSNERISENGDFIHLNTTFRAYKKVANLKFFAGVGPYANILIGDKNFDSPLYKPSYTFKNLNMGGKAEIGATHDINKFRVGLTGAYIFSLSPSATSEHLSLYNNAFSAMVTIGYDIQ